MQEGIESNFRAAWGVVPLKGAESEVGSWDGMLPGCAKGVLMYVFRRTCGSRTDESTFGSSSRTLAMVGLLCHVVFLDIEVGENKEDVVEKQSMLLCDSWRAAFKLHVMWKSLELSCFALLCEHCNAFSDAEVIE